MNQQLIERQDAENNILACATFIATNIKSSDGYAEAVKELLPYYLEKKEVDLSAELVDSISDSFTRDQLLTIVAEKCANLDDDEYALQLVEAVEDKNLQNIALEKVAAQKAAKKQFEKAFEIAENLDHASNVYAEIAGNQDVEEALETIERIEYPTVKVQALQSLAEKSGEYNILDRSIGVINEIELDEERINALLGVAYLYTKGKLNDKAIGLLDVARQIAEKLDNVIKDNFLSQISLGFLQAESVTLADRTLDLVDDKTQIARTLVGYSQVYFEKGEESESIEILDEAYQILKSQRETETRSSKTKFDLFGAIAINLANAKEFEKAIDIALENSYQEIRNSALGQIAQLAVLKEHDQFAKQAIESIDDETEKTSATMNLSDVYRRVKKTDEAFKQLNEAYYNIENVQQLSLKTLILNRLAGRYNIFGESQKARSLCTESLQIISKILDETTRVSALAKLADAFETLKFELNESEKEVLRFIIQKASV